jgi:ribosomal protein S18 acetylase RimI-like enzyme
VTKLPPVRYRSRPAAGDVAALRRLVAATRVFHRRERAIALELLIERLRHGRKSGYSFFFADRGPELVGYCAWGPVPLTERSYDLYWIAVAPAQQGRGLGQALLELAERAVARRGGGTLYIETSSRRVYDRTRRFYRAAGYAQVARLRNFYAPGDHKLMFCKVLPRRR